MLFARLLAAALFTAAACTAGNVAAGEWSCTNESETGMSSKWTLTIREDGAKLTGRLTDGEVEIPLANVEHEDGRLSFLFFVNAKPYTFKGRAEPKEIAGKYSGEEARGTLSCRKP